MPSVCSWPVPASISGRSDLLPRITPTSAKLSLLRNIRSEVGSGKSYPHRSGEGAQPRLMGVRAQAHGGHHPAATGDQAAPGLEAGARVGEQRARPDGGQTRVREARLVTL